MTMAKRARHAGFAAIAGWLATSVVTGAQPAPSRPQLVVASAMPDAASQTLTIAGGNFGNRPFVTLDLVPLTVQVAIDTQIVASAPVDIMPSGTYLLTVSRGPAAAESASLQITLGAGDAKPDQAPRDSAPVNAADAVLAPAGAEPAATVGDRVITMAELDREWRRTNPGAWVGLARLIYETRRRTADKMVSDELLALEATARGLTVEALLAEEVPKRAVTLPDASVTSLYQSLGDRTRGASLAQMRPALRAWLERITQPELAKMSYVEELMKVSTRAEILLAAPTVLVARSASDATMGPETAPVELVAFGDLQQAEYARYGLALAKVRDTFGNRVRIVFKHLPLAGPASLAAAEAAACANAQGRFWAYHDAVMAPPGGAATTRLEQLASDVGLNRAAFDGCVDRAESRGLIEQALLEARGYDIGDSPSFLVNGRLAPAPPPFLPPFEFFTRIIEEALLLQSKEASR